MEEQLTEGTRPPGKTTIAPEVLLTIARLSTLGIPGVNRMAMVPGGVHWIPKRSQAEGIRIEIEDELLQLLALVDAHLDNLSRADTCEQAGVAVDAHDLM